MFSVLGTGEFGTSEYPLNLTFIYVSIKEYFTTLMIFSVQDTFSYHLWLKYLSSSLTLLHCSSRLWTFYSSSIGAFLNPLVVGSVSSVPPLGTPPFLGTQERVVPGNVVLVSLTPYFPVYYFNLSTRPLSGVSQNIRYNGSWDWTIVLPEPLSNLYRLTGHLLTPHRVSRRVWFMDRLSRVVYHTRVT